MSRTVRDALTRMADRFPNAKISRETILGYDEDLADFPEEIVVEAIEACRKSSEFFPTVARIREMAIDILGEGTGFWVTPEAAWGEVKDAARLYGVKGYRDIVLRDEEDRIIAIDRAPLRFSSPVIARVVDEIGWEEICTTDMDKHERTLFAQFRDAIERQSSTFRRQIVSGRLQLDEDLALPQRVESPKPIGDVIKQLQGRIGRPDKP